MSRSDLKYGKGSALWDYWTKGEGFAKWSGAAHKWTTLHRLLIEAGVPANEADGLTTNIITAVMPGYMKQAHASKKGRRSMTLFTRSYPLEDISIRSSEGDGRIVEAYASVFNTPAEIHDQDGHYNEIIDPGAFNKTIAERGTKFGVFFNHGATLHGTPSDRHSMPIGVPLEVRADSRGVWTRTRYHNTPLADEVLESIRSGAITGQSFSGRMIQSKGRGARRRPSGELPTVTRTEIAMREYGPTPMPAYADAEIMGVRALRLAHELGGALDLEELTEILRAEGDLRDALTDFIARYRDDDDSPSTPQEPDTPDTSAESEAVTAEPSAEGVHSEPTLTRTQARARLLKIGALL